MIKNKRDENGLIESVTYKFTDTGEIDWRSMIDSKYLYVNQESFHRRKETPPSSIDGVSDRDLIIQLPGLRHLANLRGFTSVSFRPVVASNEYAASVCRIEWIGNYETNMNPISYEALAGANAYNTSELVQTYLIEMSENRSFCRAVRNFLRIGIVSKEEMPPIRYKSNNGINKSTPAIVLENLMKEKGRSFNDVKEKLLNEGEKAFENYKNWNDIPGDIAFKLIDRFKILKENRVIET